MDRFCIAACHFNSPASRRHARSPGFKADIHASSPAAAPAAYCSARKPIAFSDLNCAPHAENPSEAGAPQAGPKPRNSGAYKAPTADAAAWN